MGDDEVGSWKAKLIDGGVPQLVLGPAGKSLGRLIASAIDLPRTWLEEKRQSIRDRMEAKTLMSKTISAAAAQLAASDSGVVYRAMETMLAREITQQENKDAVALELIRELQIDPPPLEGEGPSDDWLNNFMPLAERASSDDLRKLFAKLLAGEIRHPGTISPMTLQLASFLDERLAREVEFAASRTTPDGMLILGDPLGAHRWPNIDILHEIGFVISSSVAPSWVGEAGEKRILRLQFRDVTLSAEFPQGQIVSMAGQVVTQAGREIIACVNLKPDLDFFAASLKAEGAIRVSSEWQG